MVNKASGNKKWIIIAIGITVIIISYLILKSWVESQIVLAYQECKKTVPQEIYKEMSGYNKDSSGRITDPNAIIPLLQAKEKLNKCLLDKTSSRFGFLGQDFVENFRSRLELKYGL